MTVVMIVMAGAAEGRAEGVWSQHRARSGLQISMIVTNGP